MASKPITVGEAIKALQALPADALLYAWAPGSYLPVHCVMTFTKDNKALMEISVPPDAALAQ